MDLDAPDKAARTLNPVLLDIYLRLEALETRARAPTSTGVVDLHVETFTTAAAVENSFPRTFPYASSPTSVKVGKPANNTAPTTLFYEAVAVDWSWASGVFTIKYITGLDALTSYSITLEIAHA